MPVVTSLVAAIIPHKGSLDLEILLREPCAHLMISQHRTCLCIYPTLARCFSLVVDEINYNANFSLNISNFDTTGIKSPDATPDTSTLTYSITQGLKSLIDDSLLAFASAQLVLHYNTSAKPVNGTLTTSAIQFGTKPYVYAIFAFNILLILLFIEESFRTHFWAALPSSNYNDLRSVVVASSIDGAKQRRAEGHSIELLERAESAVFG